MNAKSSNIALAGALAAAFAVATLALEQGTQARRQWQAFAPPLSRPLPPQLERFSLLAALGDHARVAADWAYIDCLQYIGDNLNVMDGRYRSTEAHYREVLWLDPGFQHAVLEGATVLGWVQKKVPEAQGYMADALHFDPSNQRIRFYMAALAYEKAEDPAQVVEVLKPEIVRPDAPEMLQRMVGSIYLKEKDWSGALYYFNWLGKRAKEKMTKEAVERGLKTAREGLALEGKQH